jgi:hypothetical protein
MDGKRSQRRCYAEKTASSWLVANGVRIENLLLHTIGSVMRADLCSMGRSRTMYAHTHTMYAHELWFARYHGSIERN